MIWFTTVDDRNTKRSVLSNGTQNKNTTNVKIHNPTVFPLMMCSMNVLMDTAQIMYVFKNLWNHWVILKRGSDIILTFEHK